MSADLAAQGCYLHGQGGGVRRTGMVQADSSWSSSPYAEAGAARRLARSVMTCGGTGGTASGSRSRGAAWVPGRGGLRCAATMAGT